MYKSLLLSLLLFAQTLCAQDNANFFDTEAELGLERSHLSGSIRVGADQNNTTLDMKDDLGISKSTSGLKAMFTKSTTKHKFGFKVEKYKHSGSKKLSDNIIHNGSSYATATLISSKVSLRWAKIKYRYRFTENFSLGADINGMRFKTIVNGDSTKKTLVLPAIGLDYEQELEEGLKVIVKGSTTLSNKSNYHYAYAGLSYDLKVLNCTCLHLGYQHKNLDLNEDKLNADLTYQGFYAGLAMKF